MDDLCHRHALIPNARHRRDQVIIYDGQFLEATMRLDDVLDAFGALGGPEARHAAAQFWTRATDDDIAAYLKICMPLYNKSPRDPASQGGLFNRAV